MRGGRRAGTLVAVAALTMGLAAAPAQAAGGLLGLGIGAKAAANPVPLTDLVAATMAPLTGGTQRVCATSGRGLTVRCVEHVRVMPAAMPTASGVTYGHWVFCRAACRGSLLTHELVHVGQFEAMGDAFGPRYLAEAAVHGTGCENRWERPAYEASGGC